MALVKHDERYGPYMTANNAPSPYVATASQNNWGAFRAFSESLDDDISFTGLAAGTEQWVQIKLDAAIRIWAFRIACRTTVSAKDAGQVPKNFAVQGSVDGTAFEDIQTYTNADWTQFTSWDAVNNKYDWADAKKIEVTCAKEYQHYRFQFGECQSVSTQKTDSMIPTSSNTVKLTLIDIYQVEGEEAPAELTGIEVTTPPTKLEYTVGETFDGTGMVVSRVYSDDSRVATEGYTVSGFDSSVAGIKTVTVTCDGYSATFDVIVTAQVTGITVVPPTKTEYLYGEPLDTAGMVVTAKYADDTTAVVTTYTVSGYDADTLGEQSITVSYRDVSSTFKVTVINAISGIEVTTPDKLQYILGESFDSTGMSVRAVWRDGTKTDVKEYAVSGYDSVAAGKKTITVTYEGFTDSFVVTVSALYTVTFRDWDGSTLKTETVISGAAATAPSDPVREGHTFTGWDKPFDSITEDTLITAQYVVTTYTVTFRDWDGSTLKTETVQLGTAATAPAGPERAGYTFIGWDADFSNVLSDLTVTAVYEPTPVALLDILGTTDGMTAIRNNSKNDDGTDTLEGVDWFTYNGKTASKIYVNGNNWIGFGLSAEHLKVCRRDGATWYVYRREGILTNGHKFLKIRVEGYTYYSSTSAAYKLVYEVFLFDDNSMFLNIIQSPTNSSYMGTSALVCGSKTTALAITVGSTPKISFYTEDAGSIWTTVPDHHDFAGVHTVTFIDWDGTVLWTGAVAHGTSATAPAVAEREGYTFTGWDTDFSIVATYLTVTAQYQIITHTVVFKGPDGKILSTQTVDHGTDATAPDLPVSGIPHYKTVWDTDFSRVRSDLTVTAVIVIETYTVQFKEHNGTVLDTQTVRYADDAVPPDSPAREGYVFTGWDKPYTDISADTVITATYTQYAAVTGIELQAAYTVINGETVNIPYKVLPEAANNKGVSITASDSTVIDTAYGSGWIICEGINTGESVITVTSTENSSISASCTVTVVADDVVTGVSLYPPELLLQKGKTEEIAVSVTGGADVDESVVWTSSNAAVATVKNGKVKGVADGTAVITARLKSDASFYATCSVTVEDKKDFIVESYKKGSLPKPVIIHSVSGKFKDITGKYIDGESMVIKESICDSQTLKLGGCIANSFEVLILDERLHTKAPAGEIQVYQMIEGNRVNLFNGVIYKAERVGSSLTRKLVAYDKLYSKGNKDMTAWFKKLKLPMSIKQFRTLLFKKIGIKQASVTLDIDDCIISPASYKIKSPIVEFPSGNIVEHETFEIENYTASTSGVKASDIIRDLCEAAGTCGWMNRKGVFEYIDFDVMEEAGLGSQISAICEESYYSVKCTALKKDDLEWFEGHKEVYVGGSVTPDGVIVDAYAQVEYKSEVENATYILDDNNFIVQVVVVNNPLSHYHLKGLVPIMQAVHERVSKPCQQFECQRRFNPYDKLGTIIEDKIKKETSTGKSYTWTLKSIILSRTIKGSQSMLETISAKNGPFNASNDTSRKNIKTVNVKQELAEKKISQLNATKMTGIGMTKSEFDASNIVDSNTTTYFVRFD